MTTKEIQAYWNSRAVQDPVTATTCDVWLRELEWRTLVRMVGQFAQRGQRILDIGCGDGRTTLKLAQAWPTLEFVGVDNACEMLELAARHLEVERYRGNTLANLNFQEGEVLESLRTTSYDVVISSRCLINLENAAAQIECLNVLNSRGTPHVLLENFIEPHEKLNALRRTLGLEPLGINPSNTYFTEVIASTGFADSYYFATRVIYSHACKVAGVKPDYNAIEHRNAISLPNVSELCVAPIRIISHGRTR